MEARSCRMNVYRSWATQLPLVHLQDRIYIYYGIFMQQLQNKYVPLLPEDSEISKPCPLGGHSSKGKEPMKTNQPK